MSCSPSIRDRARVGLTALGAVLLLGGLPAAAQNLEKRYQQALEAFNTAKMEDACDLLQAIEKEKPAYKETRTYLNPACSAVKQSYDMEDRLFKEGVQLFNDGKYDDAQQKFQQARGLQLRKPRRRDEIARYLTDIEARVGEDKLFAEAVKLFNEGNDTEARARFNQVIQGRGPKAAEARSYLQRIEERREESAYSDGVKLFNSGEFAAARSRLQEVVGLNGKRRAEAERYLAQIESAIKEDTAFREAERAFAQKRFTEAQAGFRQVAGMGGSHKAEAERYLVRIETAVKEEAAFKDALSKFNANDFDGARAGFQQVIGMKGTYAAEARTYLTRIEARGQDPKQVARQFVTDAQAAIGRKEYTSALERLQTASALDPTNRDATRLLAQVRELAAELPLRSGLQAFFEGKFEEADQQLSDYLNNSGRKRALAFFFRGAAHGARYFLSGEQDPEQKQLALEDFRALQKDSGRFRPPERYVSPKILALYTEATGAETR